MFKTFSNFSQTLLNSSFCVVASWLDTDRVLDSRLQPCCVIGRGTLHVLSQCLSPPKCTNEYQQCWIQVWSRNIPCGFMLQICSNLKGHLVCMQTLQEIPPGRIMLFCIFNYLFVFSTLSKVPHTHPFFRSQQAEAGCTWNSSWL